MNDLLMFADGPGIYVFGFKIYIYALYIVTGMICAMIVASSLMKKFGLNTLDKKDKNYDNPIFTYALVALPIGILGARLYPYIFPYEGQTVDWSTFFNFRSGGLGIYGGIILGTVAVLAVSLIKKHNFFTVTDSFFPGVMLAQAIGRWGNCANQEAYGRLITNVDLQWFPFAVYIEEGVEGAGWYNATFFYESLWNVIGFIVLMLLAYKKNWYRKGFYLASYFLWYGLGRFWIEGLRSDSLYTSAESNLKISQLISVIAIVLSLIGYCIIFRKELISFFRKLSGKSPALASGNKNLEDMHAFIDNSEDSISDNPDEKDSDGIVHSGGDTHTDSEAREVDKNIEDDDIGQ